MEKESRRQNDFFGICRACKINCCRNARPPITREREKIIRNYLLERGIQLEEPFVRAAYAFPREDSQGYCIFYDKKTRKCQIHPVKPETCVAGPVTFDINEKTGKIEWYLKRESICPLAGALYKSRSMLKNHLGRAKKEIRRLVQQLDPQALAAILNIEELETFKIGEDKVDAEILRKIRTS